MSLNLCETPEEYYDCTEGLPSVSDSPAPVVPPVEIPASVPVVAPASLPLGE